MEMSHSVTKRVPLGVGLGIGMVAGFAITHQNGTWILVSLGACVCWVIVLRARASQ